eukprot:7265743-Pyramimonas_sp.AAC.1
MQRKTAVPLKQPAKRQGETLQFQFVPRGWPKRGTHICTDKPASEMFRPKLGMLSSHMGALSNLQAYSFS